MRFLHLVFIVLCIALCIGAQTTQPTTAPAKPVAAIEQGLIISVDGLRPDVLLRAHTPNLRKLMDNGSFTMWAQTVPESITLPAHASMLTGVSVARHGVTWNGDPPAGGLKYPQVPTVLELAHAAGMSTAMVTGKSKFDALARPGSVDWSEIHAASDEEVAQRAETIIRQHRPQLFFVHFAGADLIGHAKGWGSDEQIATVENIDSMIGRILTGLDVAKLTGATFVLITADHGGAGLTHGPQDPRSLHIPWIIAGPGIRRDYDLTRDARRVIHTEDTFATACLLLGLVPKEPIDGKPVLQILEDRQLLQEQ